MSNRSWWIVGLGSFAAVWAVSYPTGPRFGVSLVHNAVRLSLAWYFASLWLQIRGIQAIGPIRTRRQIAARWCSTWAVLAFVGHVGLAFHYYHHWSHALAVERTREVSGWGEGIYASYLFMMLWIIEVAWWWLTPSSFAHRHSFWSTGWHAFALFIVFNGTVVFENGPIRWISILAFSTLIALFLGGQCAISRSSSRQSLPDRNNRS